VLERTLQQVVRDMVIELASSQLTLEKHRVVMRSNIKKQAHQERLDKAKQKLMVYEKVKLQR
jgi:coproporphyrinogen III oxidase-like Fe-S oxidoreductase